jgi:hypothetical protein
MTPTVTPGPTINGQRMIIVGDACLSPFDAELLARQLQRARLAVMQATLADLCETAAVTARRGNGRKANE